MLLNPLPGQPLRGEALVCRKYLKVKKQVFNVNYEYTISSVDNDSLLLNDALRVPLDTVQKNFHPQLLQDLPQLPGLHHRRRNRHL